MFRAIRDVAEAVRELRAEATIVANSFMEWSRSAHQEPPDLSAITERLDRIEVGAAKWQAEAEATLLKADALFKNARNAEERARSKQARLNEDPDGHLESEEFSGAMARWVQSADAEGGGGDGLPAVHQGVEVTGKALAVRAKFR